MAKAKFILTAKRFVGRKAGEVLELTEEQAASPLYRGRVRRADTAAELTVATPGATSEGESEGEEAAKRRGRPPKGE